MAGIPESELILNSDGSVYHLSLKPENIADTILTVGDPGRVHRVSKYFDDLDFEMNKREFITHTGRYNGKRLTVISTGMGPGNIEILLTELDALANIDLNTREVKKRRKKLNVIRLGTSGGMQTDIEPGSFIYSETAFGFDSFSSFYDFPDDTLCRQVSQRLKKVLQLEFTPYGNRCSDKLKKIFSKELIAGNTLTMPGFYAPQGRKIRVPIKNQKMLDDLTYFHQNDIWFTNFDMESSVYYALGKLLGHETISLSTVVANRVNNSILKNDNLFIDKLIRLVLERINSI